MAENFTKLFGSITASTVWMEDSDTRIVWVTMLAMCDRNGYVGASIPGLASIARVPVDKVREAIDKFSAPDPDSRSKEHDGRRIEEVDRGWVLLNYERFRAIRAEEERRERDRVRQERKRERDKSRSVTVCHAPSENITQVTESHENHSASSSISSSQALSLEASGRAIPVPLAPSTAPWAAHDWLRKFGIAWCEKYNDSNFGNSSDGKACGTLGDFLASKPVGVRQKIEAQAPRMFAEFLDDSAPSLVKARHPFAFFVTAFGGLSVARIATGPPKPRNFIEENNNAALAESMRKPS